MPDTILIKRSNSLAEPPANSLEFGELAFSQISGDLFVGQSDGSILNLTPESTGFGDASASAYDSSTSGLTNPADGTPVTSVQSALDALAAEVDQAQADIAAGGGSGSGDASASAYDSSSSGLTNPADGTPVTTTAEALDALAAQDVANAEAQTARDGQQDQDIADLQNADTLLQATDADFQARIAALETQPAGGESAATTSYDPTASEMQATTVQAALDEIDARLDVVNPEQSAATDAAQNTRLADLEAAVASGSAGGGTAATTAYDASGSGLQNPNGSSVTNTQEAIDAVALNATDDQVAREVPFDPIRSGLDKDDGTGTGGRVPVDHTQDAIDELDEIVNRNEEQISVLNGGLADLSGVVTTLENTTGDLGPTVAGLETTVAALEGPVETLGDTVAGLSLSVAGIQTGQEQQDQAIAAERQRNDQQDLTLADHSGRITNLESQTALGGGTGDSGPYTAGNGLTLTGNEFSADTSVLATKGDINAINAGGIDGTVSRQFEEFIAVEGQATYTLTKFPANSIDDIGIWRNGVRQHPSSYTVANNTITFGAPLTQSDEIFIEQLSSARGAAAVVFTDAGAQNTPKMWAATDLVTDGAGRITVDISSAFFGTILSPQVSAIGGSDDGTDPAVARIVSYTLEQVVIESLENTGSIVVLGGQTDGLSPAPFTKVSLLVVGL